MHWLQHPPMEVQRKLPVRTEEAFLHIVKLVEVLRQELDAGVVPLRRADSLAEVIEVADLLGVRLWRLAVMLHDHILPHKSEGFRLPLKPDRNGNNKLQSLQPSSSHTTNRGMAPSNAAIGVVVTGISSSPVRTSGQKHNVVLRKIPTSGLLLANLHHITNSITNPPPPPPKSECIRQKQNVALCCCTSGLLSAIVIFTTLPTPLLKQKQRVHQAKAKCCAMLLHMGITFSYSHLHNVTNSITKTKSKVRVHRGKSKNVVLCCCILGLLSVIVIFITLQTPLLPPPPPPQTLSHSALGQKQKCCAMLFHTSTLVILSITVIFMTLQTPLLPPPPPPPPSPSAAAGSGR